MLLHLLKTDGIVVRELRRGFALQCFYYYHLSIATPLVLQSSIILMTILESGWNLRVWQVGVVSRRLVWLVGGIYGCG